MNKIWYKYVHRNNMGKQYAHYNNTLEQAQVLSFDGVLNMVDWTSEIW